jgi:RNA polymerase sigma-70 factor, ECF subfamily
MAEGELAARFAAQHPYLFAVAYRMLGSRAEAEDILQDAWLRFAAVGADSIASDRAFLATIVTRLCLDRLKSATARREAYVGPWLPEPLRAEPDDAPLDDQLGLAESASMAILLVLETLTPLERAVLLLKEVFELDFDDIAETLHTSPAACRQLLHRAREHVAARRQRFRPSREQQTRLAMAFFSAARSGDLEALTQLLTDDAVAISDGGGRVPSARKEIRGKDAVARFLVGLARKLRPEVTIEPTWLNGCFSIILRDGNGPTSAALLEMNEQQIVAVLLVNNPDKLGRLDAPT